MTHHDDLMKEWETARTMLLKYDEFGHDLRKYGVSFVAGLLTADSLLGLPSSTLSVPHLVKFGAMLSVFVLIIALRLTERNYQVFQTAASLRAISLEKILDLDLTQAITVKYNYQGLWFFGTIVYIFLAGAAGILGAFILSPDLSSSNLRLTNASMAIIFAAVATGVIILIIDRLSFSRPEEKQKEFLRKFDIGERSVPTPNSTRVACPKCGGGTPPDSSFCIKCGNRLELNKASQ